MPWDLPVLAPDLECSVLACLSSCFCISLASLWEEGSSARLVLEHGRDHNEDYGDQHLLFVSRGTFSVGILLGGCTGGVVYVL